MFMWSFGSLQKDGKAESVQPCGWLVEREDRSRSFGRTVLSIESLVSVGPALRSPMVKGPALRSSIRRHLSFGFRLQHEKGSLHLRF